MKQAVLIHNPTAGSGDHNKEDLKKMIHKEGYEVKYYSTNDLLWKRFTRNDAEVIFIAGGDGTVQKVAEAMLEEKEEKILQVPVQVMPYGTANNIATTLKIHRPDGVVKKTGRTAGFDIGEVKGIEEASFFIEGLGCGIFPQLVRAMDAMDEDEKQNEIIQSLNTLLGLIDSYQAQEAIIIADKEEITGKFLLIELLNIRFIGPNIELAPKASSGDGSFELVTLREDARQYLKAYIEDIINGSIPLKKIDEFADIKKVKEVRLKWEGRDVHIDDTILNHYRGGEIVVKNRQGVFTFLVP